MIDTNTGDYVQNEIDSQGDIIYSSEKDFYRGIGGELRMKAEGLFKKAKEKGISIEDIDIVVLKENSMEFPGIGNVVLPTFIVKVKGRDISTGQIIVDGKQIDYFNRYQRYLSQRIESKNLLRDENGRYIYENKRPKAKENQDFTLNNWEKFQIGKDLLDDKEFGLEKTITGACDRIIRKLMGENDWLSPQEARLLDEEFNNIESKKEQKNKKQETVTEQKKASTRQISYFKQRLKNMGMNPEDDSIISEILKESGLEGKNVNDLGMNEMSKIIEGLSLIIPKVKSFIKTEGNSYLNEKKNISNENSNNVKQ